MQEVTRYKCDYCEKIYKHKSSARRHEKQCFANPKRKACRSCKHLISVPDKVYTFNYFYCNSKKIAINYPHERPNWAYDCPYYGEK